MKSETYTVTVTETVETTFIIRLPESLNDAQVLERVKDHFVRSGNLRRTCTVINRDVTAVRAPFGRCARDELGFRNDPQDG